jgi:hypothetical protein
MFQRHVTPRECFVASLRLHDADGTGSWQQRSRKTEMSF